MEQQGYVLPIFAPNPSFCTRHRTRAALHLGTDKHVGLVPLPALFLLEFPCATSSRFLPGAYGDGRAGCGDGVDGGGKRVQAYQPGDAAHLLARVLTKTIHTSRYDAYLWTFNPHRSNARLSVLQCREIAVQKGAMCALIRRLAREATVELLVDASLVACNPA